MGGPPNSDWMKKNLGVGGQQGNYTPPADPFLAKSMADAQAQATAQDQAQTAKLALPDASDAAVQQARLRARQQQMGMRGLKSTFVTGPRGVTGAPSLGVKTLLGG